MEWIEVKVIFAFNDRQLAVDLIADIFYEFGLQGVVVENSEIEPVNGWWDADLKMPRQDAVIGYFPKNERVHHRLHVLRRELEQLKNENSIITELVFREIKEEDWAESWKVWFEPQRIGNRIVIKPTWREFHANFDDIVIEIDPGMAFGTGTHPTTTMCIEMIEHFIKPGDSVLDIGTGSGILMIAAAKLGAQFIEGTDTDEVAVEIARKNLMLNHIEPERFHLINGNLINGIERRFNLVVANILSEVILRLLDSVGDVLTNDGILISSGMIQENTEKVLQKMVTLNFEILNIVMRETWVAVAARRNR